MRNVLIIGSDGFLGKSLSEHFGNLGYNVFRTSRRPVHDLGEIFLDLEMNLDDFSFPQHFDTAFFLAGISNVKFCEDNKEYTHHINVTKTIKLLKKLNENSIHTIFTSSSAVFEGHKPKFQFNDSRQPRNFYGACKAQVEDFILDNSMDVSIIRTGKIIETLPILNFWKEEIENGLVPKVYANRYISPVSRKFFAQSMTKLIEQMPGGVNQISANDEVNYLQIFRSNFIDSPSTIISEPDSHESLEPSGFFVGYQTPSSLDAIKLVIK